MRPNTLRTTLRSAATLGALLAASLLGMSSANAQCVASASPQLAETPEIVYTGADAQALCDKATELGTAVAIYEYAHNTIEFSPYHGSRSGSVNTFLGRRGSDVDIATTLIAMLRAPDGATIEEIMAATGWQSHTVRGAMAGALKKKLGLEVTSEKVENRGRVYKLPAA